MHYFIWTSVTPVFPLSNESKDVLVEVIGVAALTLDTWSSASKLKAVREIKWRFVVP